MALSMAGSVVALLIGRLNRKKSESDLRQFGEGRKLDNQVGLPKGSRSVRARGNAAAQRAAITQNPCAPKWA